MKNSPTKLEKHCARCEKLLPLSAFGVEARKPDGLKNSCRVCLSETQRAAYIRNPEKRIAATEAWRAKHPGYHIEQFRRYRRNLKMRIIAGYGGKCTCCGETEPAFLTLEHLNGGGRKHRGTRNSSTVYLEVIKAGFPKQYTILCMNCNFAKGILGTCPHETARLAQAKESQP